MPETHSTPPIFTNLTMTVASFGRGKKAVKWFVVSLLLSSSLLMSCVNSRELVYFQDLTSRVDSARQQAYAAAVRPGDVLSILVSSLSPEASSFFNPYAMQQAMAGQAMQTNPTTPIAASPGYLVAADGTITVPLLGAVPVAGKTNVQIANLLRDKLKTYLKEPTVSVRNQNFRVTVLGEVARPSLFNIANEQITLPEALGLAGDLTIFGRRDNVLVVREENGQRTYARLDLTKRDVFQSPYYHLHPNDVIYVEPSKTRVAATDRFYQITPLILSALSFIAIIATRF
ncbi:polysaccharide biosynthesis/export family protein [Fibrella aestuarina]|nr:polysaccharide biosynthesis/export family protein [Fibrella aestuarina]